MLLSREKLAWYERTTGDRVSASLWAQYVTAHKGTRRRPAGQHVAPYLGLNGGIVLLHIGRGGFLTREAEIGANAGIETDASLLLPRGVHVAPWRVGGRPIYLAIDSRHRCVARVQFGIRDTVPGIVRDLLLVIESLEAGELDNAPDRGWVDNDDSHDAGEEWKRAG